MAKSTVVDGSTGRSVPSEIRTSSGTFFRVGQDPVIEDVERRIAEFTMIPQENGEGIQILRYEHGQKYEAHFDYFHDRFNARPETGGNRLATLLMYLCAGRPPARTTEEVVVGVGSFSPAAPPRSMAAATERRRAPPRASARPRAGRTWRRGGRPCFRTARSRPATRVRSGSPAPQTEPRQATDFLAASSAGVSAPRCVT